MDASEQVGNIACIRKGELRNDHQMQLWVIGASAGYRFELRNAYAPGGMMIRHCVLESSSQSKDRETAIAEGNAAFDQALQA